MIVDIAFVPLGENDVRTEFVYRNSFAGLGFGLSCLIENQIGRFFARKLVFAGAREIHAGNGLVDAIAGFPAIQILKAETLLDQLDGSFAADFQNGVYDFVGAGHIGIAVLLGRKIPVGLFVEIPHGEGRHPHPASDFVDGDIQIIRRERSQFGLGFGIVEQHFGIAENRHVAGRTVVAVDLSSRGRRVLNEFDGLVAGDRDAEIGSLYPLGADALVTRGADRLRQARVAVLHLLGERHCLPLCLKFVGECLAVLHQVHVDEFAGVARAALCRQQRVGRRIVVDLGLVAVPDGEDILFGAGILLCEEHHVVLVRIFGGVELVGTFVDDRFGGLGSFLQIIGVVMSFEVDAVVFAVGSLEEAEPRFQRQRRPFVDAVGRYILRKTAAVDGFVDILDHIGHDQFA